MRRRALTPFIGKKHFKTHLLRHVTAKLRELWIIPIFFVVTTIVSMTVAYLFGTIMRLKKSQRYAEF